MTLHLFKATRKDGSSFFFSHYTIDTARDFCARENEFVTALVQCN